MKTIPAFAFVVVLAFGWAPSAEAKDRGESLPFRGSIERIDATTRERMTGVSWHRGCPVGFGDLRLLSVSHWGFDGRRHRGRLVVNRDAAAAMLTAMRSLRMKVSRSLCISRALW